MENIKVSYNENWDCEGYHTTQNIKVSKELFDKFNIFLESNRESIVRKNLISSDEMNLMVFGRKIDRLNKCLTLTQLRLLYQFLMENKIDCNRVKTDRNTMLIVN